MAISTPNSPAPIRLQQQQEMRSDRSDQARDKHARERKQDRNGRFLVEIAPLQLGRCREY